MSLESPVMLFVVWNEILEYGVTSILIQLYLDSQTEKYSCSLYLEDLKSVHLCHFWLQLTVAFQIWLTKLKTWKWSVVGLTQSTRSLTCFCGHSFYLIQTMKSFIAFPWRLRPSPCKWWKISGTYANSINHKRPEKNNVRSFQ